MNESPRMDPDQFLRSFLAIAVHYVAIYLGLLLGILFVAWAGFPKILELWAPRDGDLTEFNDAWENNPAILFPFDFCVWMLVVGVGLSVLVGLSLAYFSPFAKAGHGIFLAIICICSYLQISMTTNIPKGLMVSLLILSPTMIVIASRFGERWFAIQTEFQSSSDDALEDASSKGP